MTSLVGHLMEIEFPPHTKGWKTFPPIQLFDAPIIKDVRGDLHDLADNLRKEARGARSLVIWTDCDREGENIGAEAVDVCKQSNPRLEVKRARFSVLQARDIKQAWSTLGYLDMRQAAAVDARAELDLRIGAAFTRMQTLRLQGRFSQLQGEVISYGSCQFPTLGFVVDRYMKVQNFVAEDFWKIDVTIARDGITAKFNWARGHLFDQQFALVLYERCMDNPTATVVSIERKPKSKWAPLPLTTVEMQKVGSRSLRMSSDRIMSVAEGLYQQGIISYPRTETDVFANQFDLHSLIRAQTGDDRWGGYAQSLLDGKFKRPRKGKNDDQAHPPIHPVRAAPNLTGDDKKLFEFITRRFLACCSDAAHGNETVVNLDIAGEKFTAKGLMITERNYLDIYPFEQWNASNIPVFQQGERCQPTELKMNAGRTTGPELLTEADLIGLMEKSGIGTDATIHEHIKTILERNYVNKEGPKSHFCPTTLGMALIEAYNQMDIELPLSKPFLRSQMEASMKAICEGRRTKEDVVREGVELYRAAFGVAQAQAGLFEESFARFSGNGPDVEAEDPVDPPEHIRACPKCNSPMMLRNLKEGKRMIGCSAYPTCREAVFFPDFVKSVSAAAEDCPSCSTPQSPARLLDLEFARGSVPPSIPTRYMTCVFCDDELKELFQLHRGSRVGSSQQAQQAPTQTATQRRQTALPAEPVNGRTNRQARNPDPSTRARPPPDNHPRDNEDGGPSCQCGLPAVMRTVKKDGPNCGREFYACSKNSTDGTKCDFFEWADQQRNTQNQRSVTDAGDQNAVPCLCGEPAAKRMVKKEGPNVGREFYGCAKPQAAADRCDYFQWADDLARGGGQDIAAYRQHATGGMNDGGDEKPKCDCGLIAAVKTSNKDNENKGRQFYTCIKSASRCNFFQWADDGAGAGGGGGGGAAGDVTCFSCGKAGHFATTCPERNGGPSNSSRGRGGRGRGGSGGRGGKTRGVSKRGRGRGKK
ncbi:DNA topoisomerase 3-alpha [Rhizophlyctis rosea]|nr:DNA topoisomerase 3-alpha [Rhizophlyctis rosea]